MRSAALRREEEDRRVENYPSDRLDAFIGELTELSRKYELGITGSPTLFVMEPVDRNLIYAVDDESNLVFG